MLAYADLFDLIDRNIVVKNVVNDDIASFYHNDARKAIEAACLNLCMCFKKWAFSKIIQKHVFFK